MFLPPEDRPRSKDGIHHSTDAPQGFAGDEFSLPDIKMGRGIVSGRDPLVRMIGGTIESVFQTEIGIANPRVLDHLTVMCVRCCRMEEWYSIRTLHGDRAESVTEMLEVAEELARTPGGRPARTTYQKLGDFILFGTMIPGWSQYMRKHNSPDVLLSLQMVGSEAYGKAALQEVPDADEESELLHSLSQDFAIVSHGMERVGKELAAIAG